MSMPTPHHKFVRLLLIAGLSLALAACARQSLSGATSTGQPTVDQTTAAVSRVLNEQIPASEKTLRHAIHLLTQGLSANPSSTRLLEQRANMYAQLRDYGNAIADLERASRIKPLLPDDEFGLCLLIDRVHGYSQEAKACYARVLAKYKSAHMPGTPPSSNYVIAALAAGSPHAESLRRSYLATHSPGLVANAVRHFNRETYIHQVFP